MPTPTTGTIPALPQYGTGGLPLATTVAVEIVDSTNATSAVSYRMSQADFVGKAPGILLPAVPVAGDMIAFLRASSNLPFFTFVGNLGISAGNLPVGGATGTILQKQSGTNYDAAWVAISTMVAVGTSLATSGSATSIVVGVSNFGIGSTQVATGAIGSTQLANFAVGSAQVATNAIGNIQLRQGSPLSVIGVSGNATANVADIVAAASSGLFLQTNAGGTGLLFTTAAGVSLPVSFATPYTTAGVIYASGATALSGTNFGTTGMFLMGNGSVTAPSFSLINLGNSTSVTGTTQLVNGGTGTANLNVPFGVVYGGTTALGVTTAGTSGFVLAGTGTTSAPTFQNITTLAVTLVTAGGGLTVSVGSTGGSIANGSGTLSRSVTPSSVKTTTYTAVTGDLGSMVVFSTAALATFVLATTNATSFGAGWFVDLFNLGGTTVVIAPLGAAVITGVAATSSLGPRQSIRLVSDATNWHPWSHDGLLLSRINTAQSFIGGMTLTSFNAGTTSGGTNITFNSGNGPIQHVRNAGTGTFTAPSADGELDVLVMGTTNASTITFSGFNATTSAPVGDTYVANATSLFILSIRRINGSATYRWAALQ